MNGPPSVELLSAGDTNYDRRNILHIDERVEIFRACQIRKVDDIISHLGDFASHFFSRSQMQLDRFARAALKDARHGRVRLQSGFVLRQRAGEGCRGEDDSNKKRVGFHNPVVLRDFWSIGQQIIAQVA
jgi:hypothetical protein